MFLLVQGRSQEFATWGTKEGSWKTEVPQWGPEAEPRWGSGVNIPLNKIHKYSTQQK